MLESVNVNVASIAVIPLDWSAVRGAESDNSWRGCGRGLGGGRPTGKIQPNIIKPIGIMAQLALA